MNGGRPGFNEFNQTDYFNKRWPGWVSRAKEYFTEDINALVAEHRGETEIPFTRRPGRLFKIGVYPSGSNFGEGNDTKYGDKAETYWEKWASLGAFEFEIDGPISVSNSQWNVDMTVGDISGFSEDGLGYTITHIPERHFFRARWHLTGAAQ